jgi:voltage-gated potassium channel
MSVRRWTDLNPLERRRELARTAAMVVATWVALFGLYYLLPFDHRTQTSGVVRLLAAGIAFVAVFAWQFWQITHADLPEVRAVQALAVVIPIFLVIFATLYLSVSGNATDHFSRPLNHTSALYFAITIFSTVGFGDITPRSGGAQLLVSAQMLLDLVILGSVARLLIFAAKSGLNRDTTDAARTSS